MSYITTGKEIGYTAILYIQVYLPITLTVIHRNTDNR